MQQHEYKTQDDNIYRLIFFCIPAEFPLSIQHILLSFALALKYYSSAYCVKFDKATCKTHCGQVFS